MPTKRCHSDGRRRRHGKPARVLPDGEAGEARKHTVRSWGMKKARCCAASAASSPGVDRMERRVDGVGPFLCEQEVIGRFWGGNRPPKKGQRKMSAEDKRQLSKGLCHLSLEDIFKALEIVAKKDSSLHSNLEVVDLDLDKQSESTLWKLRSLLREAMEHNKKIRDSPNEHGENTKHKNLPRATKNSKCKYQNNDENNNLKRKEICDAPTNNVKKKKMHLLV
ncbi:hypothetical protein J5N97_012760 [Dioscorea zingiberensis]|uniref:NET domain-containing protein n=1 Tax=Dioscorea zingiberensis TaxID=325984 RepID=A0A9D5CPI9_9LILI|nr:hypothetical protein J5N97_012760 [Dioscorea zingiberensis]